MPGRKKKQTEQSRPRSTSKLVATKTGCAPLKAAYAQAVALKPRRWADVEQLFIRGMEGLDRNIANATADMADLQNGKGDFFNDLLALLLENCADVQLFSRGHVPGLIFPKHKLDVTFPPTGSAEFTLEAKAVGTPKHPGSPKQKPIGRPGSADLDKRIKEIAFKTIDLKAEYARNAPRNKDSNSLSGDLTSWLRSVRPLSYVFIAARVVSDNDRERVFRFAEVAGQVCDGVGVFCFRPISADQPTQYRSEPVKSPIELDRVLYRACVDLRAIKNAPPAETQTPSLAKLADELPLDD